MFGPLIEKAQQLARSILQYTDARARNRSRFQVAGAIYAGLLVTNEVGGYTADEGGEKAEKTLMALSLKMARHLEAEVYFDSDNEEPDFDL